jgi:hypothetical protein
MMSNFVSSSGKVQVNFTISTALFGMTFDAITLSFPINLIVAAVSNACFIQSPSLAGSWSSSFLSNSVVILLSGNAQLPAGAVTVTCSGLTTVARAASMASAPGGLQITTSKDTIAARVNTPCIGCIIAPFLPAVFGARYNFIYRSTSSSVTLNFAAASNLKIRAFVDHGATAVLMNWGSQASSQMTFASASGNMHSFYVEYVALAGTASCPVISAFDTSAIFWPESISQSPFMLTPA